VGLCDSPDARGIDVAINVSKVCLHLLMLVAKELKFMMTSQENQLIPEINYWLAVN
jgi:transposase